MRRAVLGGVVVLLLGMPSAPPAQGRGRVSDLLPNLVALAPRAVSAGGTAGGCAPVEIVEQSAQKCLRFDQIIANFGAGPFELRYGIETVATTQELRQRVYRSDSTFRDRFADKYEFHVAHAHFHYKSFGLTRLWASDQGGRRLGRDALRSGRKNGFCVIDVENLWAGRSDSIDEAQYKDPHCQVPSSFDGAAVEMVQGISRGWADIYGLQLEGQYVEITGIPDGFYLLQTIADPDDTVLENSNRDNSVFTHIQLCREGTVAQLYPPPPDFDFCGSPG